MAAQPCYTTGDQPSRPAFAIIGVIGALLSWLLMGYKGFMRTSSRPSGLVTSTRLLFHSMLNDGVLSQEGFIPIHMWCRVPSRHPCQGRDHQLDCPYALMHELPQGAERTRRPRRRSRTRSHSSSSDRRMGRWLMNSWDVEHRLPADMHPRRRDSPPAHHAPTLDEYQRQQRQRRRMQMRLAARRHREAQASYPELLRDGPPAWWAEFDEMTPRERPWTPESRSPTPEPAPAGPILERGEYSTWQLRIPWPQEHGLRVIIRVTRAFPLTVRDVVQMFTEQYPGLAEGRRMGLCEARARGFQTVFPPDHVVVEDPSVAQGRYHLMHEHGFGGTIRDDEEKKQIGEAFRLIRQHHQLSLISDARCVRTLLQAQPRTATKIIAATTTGERHDILLAGFKKAGMTSMVNAGVVRPSTVSQGPPSGTSPLQPGTPASPPTNRWSRRQPPQERDGWTLVQKAPRLETKTCLVDEWTVKPVEELRLNHPGILLIDDPNAARLIAQRLQGTQAPSALLSRQRFDLGPNITVHRVGCHLAKHQDGREPQTTPAVGWLHQMSSVHKVSLRQAPQVYSLPSRGDTVVVKLLASAKYTPPAIWAQLQKGRTGAMREEAIKQLQATAPSTVTSLHDSFLPELRGRAVTTNLRLARSALPQLLGCSGKGWLFVHPMGENVGQYPTIWASNPHPDDLEPLYKRARDLNCLGLTLGDRHIGFRTTSELEETARAQLEVPHRIPWVLSGIPMAYTASEANQVLGDMQIQGHVTEHTRRVNRAGQNWLVYLPSDAKIGEDVMQITHLGKEHIVTFQQLRTRTTQGPKKVWQRTPKKPTAQKDPPSSWAAVVKGDAPSPPTGVEQDALAKLRTMEQLVAALLALLQGPEAPVLPTSVQALLKDLARNQAPMKQPPRAWTPSGHDPSEPSELDPDEDMNGDEEADSFPDSLPALGGKRGPPLSAPDPKRHKEPPASDEALWWGHVEPQVFSHVMWGRVRGDGNCFWRAASQILDVPWQEVKKKTMETASEVSTLWKAFFLTDDKAWETMMSAQKDNCDANEACCTMLARAYARPVVIVADAGHVFATWVGLREASWEDMIVVRLHAQHYSPMVQDVTVSMVRAMQTFQMLDSHVSLVGGGSRPKGQCPHTLATWNVDSLQSKLADVLAMDASVIALQETGLTSRAQGRLTRQASSHGWDLHTGTLAPLTRTKAGHCKADRRAVPGVGFLVRQGLHAGTVDCLTKSGRWLVHRGRFQWLRLGFAAGFALVGSVYMPSGGTVAQVQDRAECHLALQAELSAWRQVPMLPTGDWNAPPTK